MFPSRGARGRGLVFDLRVTSYAPAVNLSWFLDAQGSVNGGRADNGPPTQLTCRFSNGSYNHSIAYPGPPRLGSVWYVIYSGLLPNAPGVGVAGNLGAGQTWGGSLLPIVSGRSVRTVCSGPNVVWGAAVATPPARAWPHVHIPTGALAQAAPSFCSRLSSSMLPRNAAGIAPLREAGDPRGGQRTDRGPPVTGSRHLWTPRGPRRRRHVAISALNRPSAQELRRRMCPCALRGDRSEPALGRFHAGVLSIVVAWGLSVVARPLYLATVLLWSVS